MPVPTVQTTRSRRRGKLALFLACCLTHTGCCHGPATPIRPAGAVEPRPIQRANGVATNPTVVDNPPARTPLDAGTFRLRMARTEARALVLADVDLGGVEWADQPTPDWLGQVVIERVTPTPAFAAWVDRLPALRSLAVVESVGFRDLLAAERVRRSVQVLVLRGVTLTDADVDLIARFDGLRRVSLMHSTVTDAQALRVADLPGLDILSIVDTPVTVGGMIKIRELHPTLILDADEWKRGGGDGGETCLGPPHGIQGVCRKIDRCQNCPSPFPPAAKELRRTRSRWTRGVPSDLVGDGQANHQQVRPARPAASPVRVLLEFRRKGSSRLIAFPPLPHRAASKSSGVRTSRNCELRSGSLFSAVGGHNISRIGRPRTANGRLN
jgi:hypothetical protein